MQKYRKPLSVVLVLVLVGAAGFYLLVPRGPSGYETGAAGIGDFIKAQSTRKAEGTTVMVPDTSRFLPLVATPVAVYYKAAGAGAAEGPYASPLLVAGPDGVSSGVDKFMSNSGRKDVLAIGNLGAAAASVSLTGKIDGGSDKATSLLVAKHFWTRSDAAILVRNTDDGYDAAVTLTVLASYLDIPVIVTDKVDAGVAGALAGLGVKETVVCGNMDGYGKVLRFGNIENKKELALAQNATMRVVRERLGQDINYIALANPLDTFQPVVLQTSIPKDFPVNGTIADTGSAAYPGAADQVSKANPIYYFDVPDGYTYANVVLDLWLDISKEAWGDLDGARMYAYLGVDGDNNGVIDTSNPQDKLQFFGGTPGYEDVGLQAPVTGGSPSDWLKPSEYGHLHTTIPLYNDTGMHAIQLLAKLPTDWGSNPLVGESGDFQAPFTMNITIQKLAAPTYPLMNNLSTLAPYLAAYRGGTVLAEPYFQLHDVGYIGCKDCGDPAANENVLDDANNRTLVVKKDLNRLLGELAGIDGGDAANWGKLADFYAAKDAKGMMNLGIIADPNMVPQYYYYSSGQGDPTEGFGIPSDTYYQDIAVDQKDNTLTAMSLQLAAGRVDGYDNQDVSALLARTFFYYDIINNIKGPENGAAGPNGVASTWKDSAMTAVGTEPPVGSSITAAEKIGLMCNAAGFSTSIALFGDPTTGHTLDDSRRQRAGTYYESSNFIEMCAHGFYYWYVPPAWEGSAVIVPSRSTPFPPIAGGGAFDVAHTKLMNFGPSVMWADSCITGRIDGLPPENCLSQAFLHAGMNIYIGATRESWGNVAPTPDSSSGESLGSWLSMNFFGHLTGHFYDKSGSMQSFGPSNTTVGAAMVLAKNSYVQKFGVDAGAENSDTLEEFIIHGDPAFNPYEPNNA